ncbi:hypothetical protein [Actinomadura sp. DC4]|uniref:hypothetical protein n=1 Tax=Actinomadura sp. DC4 TaxID=3055069 RepID=UPI0025B1E6C5|nr:hypothetical protein [Actinomadura sp. DC4]MDN3358341.1 hypothetical protein [Actinomadura sp. DC4]
MDERLREMFREEMSAQQQPPVSGLLEDAVRDGRRARRTQRVWIGLGSTGALAALAVGAFAIVSPGRETEPLAAAPLKVAAPVLAASSTSTVIKQPAGPKSPVTDAAVVEQLQRLLPQGRTSGYAQGPEEQGRYAFGQIYLDTGKGPGMIRAFVYKGALGDDLCDPAKRKAARKVQERSKLKFATEAQRKQLEKQLAAQDERLEKADKGCRDLPGGGRALVNIEPDGASAVTVDHGDGVTVEVFTTTWLAWNGTANPPGTIAITPAQVLKIAATPAWGAKMDSALVKQGAADHPSLPTVS